MPAHFAKFDKFKVYLDRETGIYFENLKPNSQGPLKQGKLLQLPAECGNLLGEMKGLAFLGGTLVFTIARANQSCPRLELHTADLNQFIRGSFKSVQNVWRQKCLINEDSVNLNASGGRILYLNSQEVLFSIGNSEIWTGSEKSKPRKDLGVIGKFNLKRLSLRLSHLGIEILKTFVLLVT